MTSPHRHWRALPWVAKLHDLAVCIWGAKFLLEGSLAPAAVLFGWFLLVWLFRISPVLDWLDFELPDGWVAVLLTAFFIAVAEVFLVWVYWKDAVNWIVGHY